MTDTQPSTPYWRQNATIAGASLMRPGDGAIGWVIAIQDGIWEAQTREGGGQVIGTFETEDEAKAAVAASQTEQEKRDMTDENDGPELNTTGAEPLEDDDPHAAAPPPEAAPPKRTRKPRGDKEAKRKKANGSPPVSGVTPVVAEADAYLVQRDELRAERRKVDEKLEALLDGASEEALRVAEAIEGALQ